ncbi:GntR family transcriptional regulator [Paenibacillus hodogayensis]|uniref:GntR family transcriptional regulator n=1 Tax=Paenibacillus hodogayensis TaxID=279208 RepID=A0ABV5VY87_9BACL
MSDLPLVDIAYQEIRQNLLSGQYLPGHLLSESDLAGKLNMSRTPVRAAITQLEKDGFVETLNKRGILVKEVDARELFDMFDLLNALYVYALDQFDEYAYELDLDSFKKYLDRLTEASVEKRDRDYYENGLLFMRTLLAMLDNRCMEQTFDRYKDKILFYVVAHRSQEGKHRPYTGKKLYADIYRFLCEKNYREAKMAILEAKRKLREDLLRIGLKTNSSPHS